MPDLLNISKDTVLQALARAEEHAKDSITREAEQLRKNIVAATEAIPQAREPLQGAEAVVSLEFHLPFDARSGGQISLNLQGLNSVCYTELQASLSKGKYRAFIFLHKIPGGEHE